MSSGQRHGPRALLAGLKPAALRVARSVCRSGLGRALPDAAKEAVCVRLTRQFLDPRVLPDEIGVAPLREPRVGLPCNTWRYPHRRLYWFGELYDRATQNLILRSIGPGDTFIDVGSNVGQMSLIAAAVVGPTGRVLAFEPNSEMAAVLESAAASQAITNISVHGVALGDSEGEVEFSVDPHQPGLGTVRSGGEGPLRLKCRIARGDDVLRGQVPAGRVMVKIDVEGFEPQAIEGLREPLRERASLVVCEVSPEWIGGATGAVALIDRMSGLGFDPYRIEDDGSLRALEDADPVVSQENVAFLRRTHG